MQALPRRFGIDEASAAADIDAFLPQLRGGQLLEEDLMRSRIPALRAGVLVAQSASHAAGSSAGAGSSTSSVPPPPRGPACAVRGVLAALRRWPTSCLERALVLQRWHAAQDVSRTS